MKKFEIIKQKEKSTYSILQRSSLFSLRFQAHFRLHTDSKITSDAFSLNTFSFVNLRQFGPCT